MHFLIHSSFLYFSVDLGHFFTSVIEFNNSILVHFSLPLSIKSKLIHSSRIACLNFFLLLFLNCTTVHCAYLCSHCLFVVSLSYFFYFITLSMTTHDLLVISLPVSSEISSRASLVDGPGYLVELGQPVPPNVRVWGWLAHLARPVVDVAQTTGDVIHGRLLPAHVRLVPGVLVEELPDGDRLLPEHAQRLLVLRLLLCKRLGEGRWGRREEGVWR